MKRSGIGTAMAVGLLALPGGNEGVERSATERLVPPEPASVESASDTVRTRNGTRVRSSGLDRESMTITVYNQNFGLVREVRSVPVGVGPVELEYGDVASAIQTETVHVRPLSGGFRLLEQNYQYDLLSPRKLLEKYVGRTVNVYRYDPDTRREAAVEAEVVAVNDGTILRIGGEITFNHPGRIAFPELPDDLIAEPTLVWLADSRRERQRLEVSYLTNQLDWKSDYVMVVNEDDTRGDITGWVTLSNGSGATYENAQLKLVAGDVQRFQDRGRMMELAQRSAAMDVASEARQFSEEGFFEYHLYTMARPTTVRNNEQKQVTLLEAADFGLTKRLIFHGAEYYYRGRYGEVVSNQKVDVTLEFDNSERNRLGMPLPAGIVRVYKEDASGARQFIGEDRIDHTPRDERIRIRMGDAFDVVGDRRQMDWTALGSCVSESTWEVELRNRKDDDVEVDVIEPIGGDWDIVRSTHRAETLDAHTFRFRVDVPARGETTIEYRARVRWC
ncbi:MAG: DUF4139 domain-containing protein [Gemmatimonadetes bacterium]|nr:DUF4139 domain-containing protein [Gemmatimonadota bacterium]